MSCIKTGARVFFESYGCVCPADIYGIPGTDAIVIRTNGPMDNCGSYSPENIARATHKVLMVDGDPGFWRTDLGTYCVHKTLLVNVSPGIVTDIPPADERKEVDPDSAGVP